MRPTKQAIVLSLGLRLLLLNTSCSTAAAFAFHPTNSDAAWRLVPSSVATPATTSTTVTTRSSSRTSASSATIIFAEQRESSDGFVSNDDNDNEDDDEEDDDEPPSVNVADFRAPTMSYGLFKGRSSPSQRKAMGTSGSSRAHIHICTNCGSEFIKHYGKCPTCKEWNTLQEHAVTRSTQSSSSSSILGTTGHPVFRAFPRQASWLDGIANTAPSASSSYEGGSVNGGTGGGGAFTGNVPVRITDLYYDDDQDTSTSATSIPGREQQQQRRRRRIVIPNDQELNTVLGGGLMKGSLILVGGDPGVGKSTLLLQTAASVASLAMPTPGIGMGLPSSKATIDGNHHNVHENENAGPVWYVSGEENPDQIASRASRLGIRESELFLLSETHVDSLCEQVVAHLQPLSPSSFDNQQGGAPLRPKPPCLIVIDSIQTMVCNAGGASSAGGITQVRECVALFLRLAKSTDISVLLVGHVTKSGDVAGPRTVEHMVDCVLYLEGSTSEGGGANSVRILRAAKNRFGSAEEIGLYEMTAGRLVPVSDPSSLFLSHQGDRDQDVEGSAIAISLEGRRAVAVEVQALVANAGADGGKSGYGRRTVDGISYSRLNLLMGVLQKRCGMFLARKDVYINVVGQLRLDRGDNSNGDLAVVMALVSSLASIAVRSDTAFVGEVGLLGELRPMSSLSKRLLEARRMGFSRIVTPPEAQARKSTMTATATPRSNRKKKEHVRISVVNGIEWIQCERLMDAINAGLVDPVPKRRRKERESGSERGAPGMLEDLDLEEITDDGDDDDDDEFLS